MNYKVIKMTIKISTDHDRDDIKKQYGRRVDRETIRQSNAREQRLETSSQRRTGDWGLRLDIDPDCQTAYVEQEDEHAHTVVSGREFAQPVTNLDPQSWDYLVQRALSWHENGHVLFTDHEDLKQRLDQVNHAKKGFYQQFWNALEDGAIETRIVKRWSNAAEPLRVLRANLFADSSPGTFDIERNDGSLVYSMTMAAQVAALHHWMEQLYDLDIGVFGALLDKSEPEHHFRCGEDRQRFANEIAPAIKESTPGILAEDDPKLRNAKIFELAEEILPVIEESVADGLSQAQNRSGSEHSSDGSEGETPEGMPEDSSSGSGSAQADETDQIEIDPDSISGSGVPGESGDGDEDEDGDSTGTAEGSAASEADEGTDDNNGAGASDAQSIEDVKISDELEADLEKDVRVQRVAASGATDEIVEELEELLESLDSDDNADNTIQIPNNQWTADQQRLSEARQGSRPIAQILRNRLQNERESEVKRHQRRGRYTGRGGATLRAARGEDHIKQRTIEPEDKDYHFAFVLDRSGSMDSTEMCNAELALGMLSMALEDVGVKTMIIDLYQSKARLAKPFGSDVEQHADQVFSGASTGGTPLHNAVDLARARLKGASEHTAMVVLTDGVPDDEESFESALESCLMPVIGITLTEDTDERPVGADQYHRSLCAEPGSDLRESLVALVKEVMF